MEEEFEEFSALFTKRISVFEPLVRKLLPSPKKRLLPWKVKCKKRVPQAPTSRGRDDYRRAAYVIATRGESTNPPCEICFAGKGPFNGCYANEYGCANCRWLQLRCPFAGERKKPCWTEEEEQQLLDLAPKWTMISEILGSRTPIACQTHHGKVLQRGKRVLIDEEAFSPITAKKRQKANLTRCLTLHPIPKQILSGGEAQSKDTLFTNSTNNTAQVERTKQSLVVKLIVATQGGANLPHPVSQRAYVTDTRRSSSKTDNAASSWKLGSRETREKAKLYTGGHRNRDKAEKFARASACGQASSSSRLHATTLPPVADLPSQHAPGSHAARDPPPIPELSPPTAVNSSPYWRQLSKQLETKIEREFSLPLGYSRSDLEWPREEVRAWSETEIQCRPCYENWGMNYECCPSNCAIEKNAKGTCTNRFLTGMDPKVYNSLEPAPEEGRGLGLKTNLDIAAGTAIGEYKGKPITEREYEELRREDEEDSNRFQALIQSRLEYVMIVGEKIWEKKKQRYLDASINGNALAFVNHSCDPNCEMHEWVVDGFVRLVLVASKNIAAGEFLSFQYRRGIRGGCRCGSGKCPQPRRYCYCGDGEYGTMVACDNQNCPYEWFHIGCLQSQSLPKGAWKCLPCILLEKKRKMGESPRN